MKELIPKNLNKWFKDLSQTDKEDTYKYWLNQNSYTAVEAPEFVDPIDYFKIPHLGETTSVRGREYRKYKKFTT